MAYVDIAGTGGDDVLVIDDGDHGRIRGLGGDDKLSGASGADTLDGGDGADTLLGNAGDDVLIGGTGDDLLDGGDGYDIADYGTAGAAVTLDFSGGQHVFAGEWGLDQLLNVEAVRGTAFNDTIYGNRNATIIGGDGDDILGWSQIMDGGNGDDVFLAPGGFYNDYLGGAGFDVVDFSYNYGGTDSQFVGITVDLNKTERQKVSSQNTNSSQWWFWDNDLFSSIEGLKGSSRQDRFIGTAGDETFWGGGADDTLEGRGGDDLLDGGSGADFAFYGNASAAIAVDLRITTAQAIGAGEGSDTLASIENVWGSAHGDALTGDDGANALWGQAGDDTLQGGAGDDVLRGGYGDDVLDGGAGFDMVDFRDQAMLATAMYNATPGVNVTFSGLQNAGELGVDQLINFEGLHGSYLDDVITGDAARNVLEGHNGRDVIYGMGGDDEILGGGDADTIYGGDGNDWI
ncbi:MAG TPA: calcium-binding protein, partial [Caulobacteraceae bacterium]|nr:calcium-binding protein [Caulobacteraceae bacterium]